MKRMKNHILVLKKPKFVVISEPRPFETWQVFSPLCLQIRKSNEGSHLFAQRKGPWNTQDKDKPGLLEFVLSIWIWHFLMGLLDFAFLFFVMVPWKVTDYIRSTSYITVCEKDFCKSLVRLSKCCQDAHLPLSQTSVQDSSVFPAAVCIWSGLYVLSVSKASLQTEEWLVEVPHVLRLQARRQYLLLSKDSHLPSCLSSIVIST